MRSLKYKLLVIIGLGIVVGFANFASLRVSALELPAGPPHLVTAKLICGQGNGDKEGVKTAIDIGCQNRGNPIIDMLFAVIRFLSNGVGIVIIGSIIVGGIEYTTSSGDPQKTAKAVGRIRATLIALGLYIFSYPLLNYVLPSGFFK